MQSRRLQKGFENMNTIDEYIETFEPEIQRTLKKIRNFIRAEVPEATEKMSYGMPTFYLNGNLVHFAVFKNHYSLFPCPSGIEELEKEFAPYRSGKGTLRFLIDKPIPWKIIKKLIGFRVKENMNKTRKMLGQKSVRNSR